MNAEPSPVVPSTAPELPEIIHRWTEGETITELAPLAGVTPQALYQRIYKYVFTADNGDDAYQELKRQAAFSRIAEADCKLDTAKSMLELARAREQAKLYRMDAERICPKVYAAKQQIDVDKRITVIVHRETPQPVVVGQQAIEAQSQVIENIEG